jgi:hypothetical protein
MEEVIMVIEYERDLEEDYLCRGKVDKYVREEK